MTEDYLCSMRKVILLSVIFLSVTLNNNLPAQTQGELGRRFFSNWSVGIGGGPNIFFGDLKVYDFWPVSTYMNEWRFAGTFTLTRQISHVFAVRGQLLYGEISGTKRVYKGGAPCNQYFEGNIFEYNLNTTINFINLFFPYKPTRKFFIYGTVGIGFSNWNTKKKDLITSEQIGGSGSPSNWTTEVVIPAGLGAYFTIADKVNLGLEWTLRAVNSDKLDTTVGGFQYDMYSLLSFNVTYNFNKRAQKKVTSTPGMANPAEPAQFQPPVRDPMTKPQKDTTSMEPAQVAVALNFPAEDTIHEKNLITTFDSLQAIAEVADTGILSGENGPLIPGISYRVQVYAYKSNIYPAESIRRKFNLSQVVYKEFSEGWFRYTLGSFKTLKAAQSLMYKLRSGNGIHDAFVARYKDGFRFPVPARK